jgi:hypothetical protein
VHPLLTGLEAVISGGQTGADQAGIRVARGLGLQTGGYAPLGFRTLAGPAPWLGAEYGLVENWTPEYAARTARCVFAADATVRIAQTLASAGELCTLRQIQKYKKPHLDVEVSSGAIWCAKADGDACLGLSAPDFLRDFLVRHRVRVLNVAGNSEGTAPGIGAASERFLRLALAPEQP